MYRSKLEKLPAFFPAMLLALCLSGVVACGQKGPLFMPPDDNAVESTGQQLPAEETSAAPQDTADLDESTD